MARNFDAYDYLVFAGTLIISMGIGVFFAFHKGGQTTTKQFLLGFCNEFEVVNYK